MKTRLIIVAAPSGAGKSSFVERICREDSRLVDNITYTTRSMRKGESEGNPYHYISLEEFEKKVDQGFFVEWARVHTNFYGTSFESLEKAWAQNKTVIMDIDVQGTATFRAQFPDAKTIFILPPSIDELRRRVIKRDGGVPVDLEVRMSNAEKEMLEAPKFDFQVVNEDFEVSFAEFKKIIEKLLS
ncbi:MAG: guanylate kinase [Bdellovibrionia bacterium]